MFSDEVVCFLEVRHEPPYVKRRLAKFGMLQVARPTSSNHVLLSSLEQ
jgi:hypothetical protein